MNNQMHVFKITVPGKLLDNKLYYQYDDFDSSDPANPPTDVQSEDKSKAFVRMRYFNIQLASLIVPIYATFEPETEGTCSVIPDSPVLNIGYMTYEPFLSTLSDSERKALDTEDKRTAAAAEVLKNILIDAMSKDLPQEQVQVQKTISRLVNALSTDVAQFKEISIVDVDVPGSDVAVTVEYVKL